jgi:hypothetical protein
MCKTVRAQFALYYGWATPVFRSPVKFLWTAFGDTKDSLLLLLLFLVEDQHHGTQ